MTTSPNPPTSCPACASTSAQLALVRRALGDLTARLGRMEAPDPAASYLAEGVLGELVMPQVPPITVTVQVGQPRVILGEELRVEPVAEKPLGVEVSGAALAEAIKPEAEVPAEPAVDAPAAPTAPPPKTTRRVSERVAEMMRGLGVDHDALSSTLNSTTPRGAAAVAARRALVGKLKSEGLSAAKVAEQLGLEASTVYSHLRALREGK